MVEQSVVIGIIRDNANQQIFIAKRPDHVEMGGFWEFPGGKVQLGETPQQALIRELQEEVGITVSKANFCAEKQLNLPHKTLTLLFYLVEEWQGEPYGKEGQPTCWLNQQQLVAEQFPPANQEIVASLQAGLL